MRTARVVAGVRRGERKVVELLAPKTAFSSTGEKPGASQGRAGLESHAPRPYHHRMFAVMNHRESHVLEQDEMASRTLRLARAGVACVGGGHKRKRSPRVGVAPTSRVLRPFTVPGTGGSDQRMLALLVSRCETSQLN